jgi:hypothetical protein
VPIISLTPAATAIQCIEMKLLDYLHAVCSLQSRQ